MLCGRGKMEAPLTNRDVLMGEAESLFASWPLEWGGA